VKRATKETAAGRRYLDLQRQARRTGRPTDELIQLYALECCIEKDIRTLLFDGGASYDTRVRVSPHFGKVASSRQVPVGLCDAGEELFSRHTARPRPGRPGFAAAELSVRVEFRSKAPPRLAGTTWKTRVARR
jgi:hypothetical protein